MEDIAKGADGDDYESIKDYLLDDDVPKWIDCEIAKAIVPQIKTVEIYQDDLPPDLAEAIRTIVKACITTEAINDDGKETIVAKEDEVTTDEKPKEVAGSDHAKLIEDLVPKITESVMAAIDQKDNKAKEDEAAAVAAAAKEADQKNDESQPAGGDEEISAAELGRELASVVVDALSG